VGNHFPKGAWTTRLELGIFHIKNIAPNHRTLIQGQTLFINLKELREIIFNDPRFANVEIEIVHPGDNVRVINVLDVIELRIKA
jgi:glycine reductase